MGVVLGWRTPYKTHLLAWSIPIQATVLAGMYFTDGCCFWTVLSTRACLSCGCGVIADASNRAEPLVTATIQLTCRAEEEHLTVCVSFTLCQWVWIMWDIGCMFDGYTTDSLP